MSASFPRTIGRYAILDRLAVGGMAELFKAQLSGQHGFEKLVTIKKILPHLAVDRSFIEMFIDEARLTAQLDHPHIVQVFELGTDADTPYIAMQFVDGLDVLGLLRECARAQIRLPPHIAAFIARDVLDALDYAHQAVDGSGRALGVIHRDISPGNVLLSWRGDVKLTDFGIARAVERRHKTEAGTLKGKYGYMSPEQVLGAEVDYRTDIFTSGILLAEMVMARRLFTAANDLDILLQVRDARLERLHKYASEFPEDLRAIVAKALQRRPEARWQNAAAMREALDEWLAANGRTTQRDLAAFLQQVVQAPTSDLSRDAAVGEEHDELAMSGPRTRERLAQAEAEVQAARARFMSNGDSGDDAQPFDDDGEAEPIAIGSYAGATELGDLAVVPTIRLLYRLTKARGTGLLKLELGATVKEAYLADGQPLFVTSNVPAERLSRYLVAEGMLTRDALARARAVMPTFGGKLADTLVGLDLLTPLEAYRLLATQVGSKLINACGWNDGRYTWAPGHPNPWKTRALHLDMHRIIGAGASQLGKDDMERWAEEHGASFAIAEVVAQAELNAFGLGETLLRVHALLDGRTRLRELLAKVRSADARLNLIRLVFLAVQTDLARLS
ncbi:MAG: serine/threonine protein kinase [Myxococcales bacterium]|jgi:serine/threonine protein kinase|nr:serine/threonine protein kinase [Myxococcales bacterium]